MQRCIRFALHMKGVFLLHSVRLPLPSVAFFGLFGLLATLPGAIATGVWTCSIPCQGLRRPVAPLAALLQAVLDESGGSWVLPLQHAVTSTGSCCWWQQCQLIGVGLEWRSCTSFPSSHNSFPPVCGMNGGTNADLPLFHKKKLAVSDPAPLWGLLMVGATCSNAKVTEVSEQCWACVILITMYVITRVQVVLVS